jgi:hypothetical protein
MEGVTAIKAQRHRLTWAEVTFELVQEVRYEPR